MGVFDGATAPGADVLEVILFGPGYGESIAVHLGFGDWIIVDSCMAPDKTPAPLSYLNQIGISTDQVKFVVVTHWHDDHSKGAAAVASACTLAKVGVSNVLNIDEGRKFLTAFSGELAAHSVGTSEIYQIFRGCKGRLEALGQNRLVLSGSAAHQYRVTALSPTDACFLEARAEFQRHIPDPTNPGNTPLRHAPMFTPNNEAVALHVAVGEDAILLGSDLETKKHGWSALTEHEEIGKLVKANLYKVAHHGSKTAECAKVWDSLLAARPLSLMTPFHHGKHRLPNQEDRTRINARSSSAHISSIASAKAVMDPKMAQRLAQLGSAPVPVAGGFGAVRARKKIGSPDAWEVTHFGHAGVLR